jgi:hypothetical protein
MAQRAIRFSETTDKRIHEATEKRGFSSPTAYIRYPVDQVLSGSQDSVDLYSPAGHARVGSRRC